MAVPFTCADGNFVFVLSGKVFYLNAGNPVYAEVVEKLQYITEDELRELLESRPEVKPKTTSGSPMLDDPDSGVVMTADGTITVNGEVVHNAIASRIRQFAGAGLPYDNLLLFLKNVSENPSYGAQQELFEFLENRGLPVTEDGCFLAYKAVRNDWRDKYSGTIDNSPGQTVEMTRHKVDDNRARHCSAGLHCGALDYISWYGGGSDKIIVVKVNPKDVVSVPNDHSCQKCRVCKYVVLREFEGEYNEPLVNEQGDYDDEYEDKDVDLDLSWADNAHRCNCTQEEYEDEGVDEYDEDDCFDDGDVCSYCDEDDDEDDIDDGYHGHHGRSNW